MAVNRSYLKVTKDKLPEFIEAMRVLSEEATYVGIPEGKDGRKADEPIGNAGLGYLHENGSDAQRIPARPFLIPGIAAVREQLADELGAGARAFIGGRTDAVRTSYTRAGIIAVSSVKKTIVAGEGFMPLAPATLRARRERGVTRTNPLIDTGQLLNSVTFAIRKKNA